MKLPRLRYHRLRLGLTQEELAKRAGLARRSIICWESGKEARPNMARKVAEALGTIPGDLMEEPEIRSPKGLDLISTLRAMEERHAPGKPLGWSRSQLDRIADQVERAAQKQFQIEFGTGNDDIAQEIAMTSGAVSELLRARAKTAPLRSSRAAREEVEAARERLKEADRKRPSAA